ncbi:SGNH/GDSL hydrolase family protein [Bacillus massiliigorillae]|uniref:SGNH/GDSL hydrolase family protein n=1 Tax=Bacillus massiliigorillae TaxID=1243664 RepID=UPI0003A62BAD|nr:SGNH/GDSL hydrolase family protein [Bacillus massiliigorillae]
MWKNFVAIGDSFTEGIGDEVEGVELKSWAEQFSQLFEPALSLTNLAKRGLIAKEIRSLQLEKAVALQPDLVSIIAGANDILKGRWNPEEYREEMRLMVSTLSENGAAIIIANQPDFSTRLPISDEQKQVVKKQVLKANEIIDSICKDYEVFLMDFWSHPFSNDLTLISKDLVHPNSKGYREIAHAIFEQVNASTIS